MPPATNTELKNFLDQWRDDANGCKQVFLHLKSHIAALSDIELNFVARPGVTYSLRAARTDRTDRALFALIDMIDENPRWLSVCFYEDLVSDPEELGDLVPGGIMGEDGYCFDVESQDPAFTNYLCRRIDEARENNSPRAANPF